MRSAAGTPSEVQRGQIYFRKNDPKAPGAIRGVRRFVRSVARPAKQIAGGLLVEIARRHASQGVPASANPEDPKDERH